MEKILINDFTPILGMFEKGDDSVVFKGNGSMEDNISCYRNNEPIGIILYPKRFKEGRIKAWIKFEKVDDDSIFGIIFDYIIQHNSNQSFRHQFAGISNRDGYICNMFGDLKRFSYAGQQLIEQDKEYVIMVDIRGALLQLYVNDVLVGSCNISKFTETNIGLYFNNSGNVQILGLEVERQKPKAFVVMQFSDDYKAIYEDVIKAVCGEKGFEVIRGDESRDTGMIISDIVRQIEESSVIIADITPDNPNVFYEVGYAHALRKPTILMSDKTREKLPFDLSGFRTIFYDNKIGGKNIVEKMLGGYLDDIASGM